MIKITQKAKLFYILYFACDIFGQNAINFLLM